MSHHVGLRLPDGRMVFADYRVHIVTVIRRCLKRAAESQPADPDDLTLIQYWADHFPGQMCTLEQIRDGSCTSHGPAEPGPVKLRPYPGQATL